MKSSALKELTLILDAASESEVSAANMGIMIDMADTIGIEQARAPDQAVNLITFAQQEFRQIGSVLAGDARY